MIATHHPVARKRITAADESKSRTWPAIARGHVRTRGPSRAYVEIWNLDSFRRRDKAIRRVFRSLRGERPAELLTEGHDRITESEGLDVSGNRHPDARN